jgi:hypothetical protein
MSYENGPDADAERQRPESPRRGFDPGAEPGLKSQVWVVGLVGIVVILLALFSLVL